MNLRFFLTFIISTYYLINTSAQEKRTFSFNGNETEYFLFSNMTPSFTKYPNHAAKFIVVNSNESLLESPKKNKIDNIEIARKDETLYYYFELPRLKNEKLYIKFFEKFVEENYRKDFFNRNTVSIDFQNIEVPVNCEYLEDLNSQFAKIIVTGNSSLIDCDKKFVIFENSEDHNLVTTIKYEPITIKASEQKRKDFEVISQLDNWKRTYYITVTLGHHFIDNSFQKSFDEETLVDINDVNSIWHFGFGYMFTNKIGGSIHLGLMTSKEQSINTDGGGISGSGSGLGIFKLGIGARYIPFAKDKWSMYGDINGGALNVKAGGGSGGLSGSDFTEKSEKSNYLSLAIGTNCRLGRVIFLNGNIEYTASNFETNIGSISGFTGYTINIGIGFSFK